jgi:transposase
VVDALLTKLTASTEVSLSAEEQRVLAGVLETWAHVVERAQDRDFNISQLRKILGIFLKRQKSSNSGPSGEGSSNDGEDGGKPDVEPEYSSETSPVQDETSSTDDSGSEPSPGKNRDEHGRRSAEDFPGAPICYHGHPTLVPGCQCPQCNRGKLYKYRPSQYMTISGQPVFAATKHVVDQLQCNLCDAIFKAPLSEGAQLDGAFGNTLYSYSAVAMIAIFKFFGVVPWHRMETLQDWIGVHVPDASMFDQCERLANTIAPVVNYLERLSADAPMFYGDDTGACVINERRAVIAERKSGKLVERTGCHTTCVIAVTSEGHRITHFRIGIQHTGEVLDQILEGRDSALPAPLVMSDALSANSVTVCKVHECFCNTHALRNFKDLKERYPEEAGYALERYKKIYNNEDQCQEHQLTAAERLAYHKEHSRPLLQEICTHCLTLIDGKEIEPNSDIGRAYNYVYNHEYELSAFCRYPGAPLDNNLAEQTLRLPVHLRDAAPFYRNGVGAKISTVILTLGVTAYHAGVNLLDYFVAMLRHANDVRSQPHAWLPWCYKDRVCILESPRETAKQADSCARTGAQEAPLVPIVHAPAGATTAVEPAAATAHQHSC